MDVLPSVGCFSVSLQQHERGDMTYCEDCEVVEAIKNPGSCPRHMVQKVFRSFNVVLMSISCRGAAAEKCT